MRIAGIGFRAGADVDSLADALAKAVAAAGARPDALATMADKAESAAFLALANRNALPILALPRNDLAGIATLTQSPRVHAMLGTGSAAEALALAALAPGARLLGPRCLSSNRLASAAIAEGESP